MVSIVYPNTPAPADLSGFERGLSALAEGLEERRAKKALDMFADSLYGGQQPMSLSALAPQDNKVTRAPLPPVDDPSRMVAQAHAASGPNPPVGAIEAYIRHAAKQRGIDPDTAVKVAMSEGGVTDPTRQSDVVKDGVREQSYGPFQLYMNGGLGNEALAAGIDPRTDWKGGINFALDKAKEGGWGPWYGAAKVGVGERDGLDGPQGTVEAFDGTQPSQVAQSVPAASGGNLLPPPDVMRALLRNKSTRQFGAQIAQEAMKARRGDPEAALRLEKLRAEIDELRNPNARDKFGNSVIWGQDADGKWVAMQPSSAGGLEVAKTPEGVNLSPPGVGNLDLGTEYGIRDRNGNIVNRVEKDLTGAERDKTLGKDQGEAAALYQSMTSKMPGLRQVVGQLDKLTEEATYTWAGRAWDEARKQFGMDPRAEAVARAQYTAIVDNQILPLLRDTFGAQFTVAEGESLRATLGDPNKSPAEKKAVLQAFVDQKERDIEALARRTGQQAPNGGADYKTKYGLD